MKYFTFFCLLLCFGCSHNPIPKPNAYLSLSYPKKTYVSTTLKLPFKFKIAKQARYIERKKNWLNIHYPKLKADIHITYQPIYNNLQQLIVDAEKLTYKHTLKADHIEMFPFENSEKKVYARLFEITGNAASPIQFQATDSLKHFISGSLYFDVKPNYDSILPAIVYVKKDIQKFVETLEWHN